MWLEKEFIDLVRKRGSEIILARGKSSAASAAHALIEAVRDTLHTTETNHCFSSGVISDGNGYGIEEGLIFSFPCQIKKWKNINCGWICRMNFWIPKLKHRKKNY